MIRYLTDDSPFFVANKKYCEDIENKLRSLNIDCSGECNSFGYDIEGTFIKNSLTYTLKFHKHQSTQNAVVIPVNAIDYAGVEILVKGLDRNLSLSDKNSKYKLHKDTLSCKMHSPKIDPAELIADIEQTLKSLG